MHILQTVRQQQQIILGEKVRKMMKKAISLLIVCVIVLGIAPLTVAQDGGTILMWAAADLTNTEDAVAVTLASVIEAFEEETGITVEYEQVAWDQMSTKLALQAQSGAAMPDIVETASQHVLPLINTGALMDITDLVADFEWLEELNASEAQSCVVGEERFCVAADIRGGAWYYNVDSFEDGWPTTAEEWLEAGAQLKEDDLFLSTFFAGRHYGAIELTYGPMIYSNGGRLFDDEGLPAWASEETVEVVEWMRELLANEYVPETVVTGDFTAGETPWVDGTAASVRGGSWSYLFIPGLQEAYENGDTQLGLAPSFNDGPNYVFLVGEGWGIADGAENVDGAVAFLDFFMKTETLAEWAANHYGIPTIDSAIEEAEAFAGEFYVATAENLAENGIFIEPSTCYVEGLTKLSEVMQELMLDPELDAMELLQEAQDEVARRCDPLF
jgi:ABC-type glycerol-3-phosphate transport system substrate-binding protein